MERRVHGKELESTSCIWKAKAEHALKETFGNSHGVAWLNLKAFAATFCQSFGVDPQDFVVTGVGSTTNTDSFRGGDARVTTGHSDRFQKIDTIGIAFRHFVTAGPIHLAENRKAAFGVTDERDIDFWIHQIVAAIKVGNFRSGLGES